MHATPTHECKACDGKGRRTVDMLAFNGAKITFTCAPCAGTGAVACICRAGYVGHYMTCPAAAAKPLTEAYKAYVARALEA